MPAEDKVLIFAPGGGNEFELLDKNRSVTVSVEALKKNLTEFKDSLSEILPALEIGDSKYGLKAVSVAVGFNAKGQVGFLGTGAELGSSATLTLTFEKK